MKTQISRMIALVAGGLFVTLGTGAAPTLVMAEPSQTPSQVGLGASVRSPEVGEARDGGASTGSAPAQAAAPTQTTVAAKNERPPCYQPPSVLPEGAKSDTQTSGCLRDEPKRLAVAVRLQSLAASRGGDTQKAGELLKIYEEALGRNSRSDWNERLIEDVVAGMRDPAQRAFANLDRAQFLVSSGDVVRDQVHRQQFLANALIGAAGECPRIADPRQVIRVVDRLADIAKSSLDSVHIERVAFALAAAIDVEGLTASQRQHLRRRVEELQRGAGRELLAPIEPVQPPPPVSSPPTDDTIQGRHERCMVLYDLRRFEEARTCYQAGYQKFPGQFAFLFDSCQASRMLGQWEEARDCYRTCLRRPFDERSLKRAEVEELVREMAAAAERHSIRGSKSIQSLVPVGAKSEKAAPDILFSAPIEPTLAAPTRAVEWYRDWKFWAVAGGATLVPVLTGVLVGRELR